MDDHKMAARDDCIVAIGIFTALKALADKNDIEEIKMIGRTLANAGAYPSPYSPLYYVIAKLAEKEDLSTINDIINATLIELKKD